MSFLSAVQWFSVTNLLLQGVSEPKRDWATHKRNQAKDQSKPVSGDVYNLLWPVIHWSGFVCACLHPTFFFNKGFNEG